MFAFPAEAELLNVVTPLEKPPTLMMRRIACRGVALEVGLT